MAQINHASLSYSEPHSILAPEATPMAAEELERLLQEKMGEQKQEMNIAHSSMQQQHRYFHEPLGSHIFIEYYV